jgi:hypothetical protein
MLALLLLGQMPSLSQPTAPSGGRSNDKGKRSLDSVESQAIQVLLDGVGSEALGNANFLAMSYDPREHLSPDTITAHILAWFKYSATDHAVVVDYFLVPWLQKYGDRFLDNWQCPDGVEYRTFLQKIVSDKKITDTDSIKRLEIPLPVSLRNDVWFDKLCRIYEYGQYSPDPLIKGEKPKVTIEWMTFDSVAPYYNWGIKCDGIEHIQGRSFRDGKFVLQINYEILEPIVMAILEHETPKEWKEDYEKYTQNGKTRLVRSTCPAGTPDRGNR